MNVEIEMRRDNLIVCVIDRCDKIREIKGLCLLAEKVSC